MEYEGNAKHKEPWQRGRRGSLCPKEAPSLGQTLLVQSEAVDEKRYACHQGKAYCGKEHLPGRWHGWPVGWVEVPEKLRAQWLKDGKVKRQDIQRYWDGDAE